MSKVEHRTNKQFENDDCMFYLELCEFPDMEDEEAKPDIRIHFHGGLAHFGYEFESKEQLKEIIEYLGEVHERWEDE